MNSLTIDQKLDVIENYHRNPEQILNILIDLQFASAAGYIDSDTIKIVANTLHLTETRVSEIISFYSILKAQPQAKYVIKICNSSPCRFSHSSMVFETLEKTLEVKEYQMTPDGTFMYHGIPCFGACDQDPSLKIKDHVFEDLTPEKIVDLITDLQAGRYPELLGGN